MKRRTFLGALCAAAAIGGIAWSDDGENGDATEEIGGCEPKRFEFAEQKMGVPTRIVLYARDQETAEKAADAVWRRFDELNAALSDYDSESEIVRVCRESGKAGAPVAISADLRRTLEEARRFCVLTDGAFDVTVSPVVKLWRRSRYFNERPPEKILETAKKTVGLANWKLTEAGVETAPGVRFDVGGIAKGLALDEALATLRTFGIESALVDAGGDLRLGAAPPGKDGWTIGIAGLEKEGAAFYRTLANVGVASSGDANRFLEIDGVRYSHIIDPRTGEPLTRRCVATVVAPSATAADALASAVCVLGLEGTPELVERLKKSESNDEKAGAFDPLETILYRVKSDAEAPFSAEEIDVFATPGFADALDGEKAR
ncbi:MAG: FAD:protein FMN transferase [Thermoguttaceae bacterium]|nr:FAD:protein FMN transferase [Thermoguttaceae bacterium]